MIEPSTSKREEHVCIGEKTPIKVLIDTDQMSEDEIPKPFGLSVYSGGVHGLGRAELRHILSETQL